MLLACAAAFVAGGLITGALASRLEARHAIAAPPGLPVRVTMYRFEMNPGALGAFDRWMQFQRDNRPAIIGTLEREWMYVEAMFRDTVAQPDVIYWLAVDGEGGAAVDDSPLEVDRKHNEFMREVIRRGSRRVMKTEFSLLPPFLDSAITAHRIAGGAAGRP